MKRLLLWISTIVLSILLMGCANSQKVIEPDITQIQSICTLATLECYYHNVAKSVKTAGEGISHIGEKDRKFWIEYTGIAKVGIDMSKVSMTVNGTEVKIELPEAELVGKLDIKESDLKYVFEKNSWNENKITVEDETKAIEDAQKEMSETIKNNKMLLLNARSRAQELIENYVVQISKMTGIDYKITWIYEDGTQSQSDISNGSDTQK